MGSAEGTSDPRQLKRSVLPLCALNRVQQPCIERLPCLPWACASCSASGRLGDALVLRSRATMRGRRASDLIL
ncbi:hypothetical protein DEG02_021590 [Xanthomonas vasicola]|nr:hypothetical protein NX80_000160 [Xanthomonas vasicola pv. arecae]AZR29216.1 hypothetical protein KWO_000160 [Xanthomonas vasicola pv. musacearum NCPPB 4379]RJL80598.1 hypothetical protein DEG03_022140 [Xanthomonas vasicola]RRJ35536.1 hypothetical protein EIM46_21705 [Xanthomonas vasicola pv. musacearum]RJL81594.1 hypothetical protein DEF98_021530 [Xanthomonas vasicola]